MDNNFENNEYRYTSGPNPGQLIPTEDRDPGGAPGMGPRSSKKKKEKKSNPVPVSYTHLPWGSLTVIIISASLE